MITTHLFIMFIIYLALFNVEIEPIVDPFIKKFLLNILEALDNSNMPEKWVAEQ